MDSIDIIKLYIESLIKKELITPAEQWDFEGYTRIANVWIETNGDLLFRFEAHFWAEGQPVCQYVTLKNNELVFRDELTWFVPANSGDICFNSYKAAKDAAFQLNASYYVVRRQLKGKAGGQ